MSTTTRRMALAGLAAALALSAASPAQAALELYADANYKGWLGAFTSAMSSPHNMSTNANDALTSFRNITPYSAAFYHDKNGGGRCFTARPGDQNAGLGFWDNDKISSFQLGRSC